MIIYMLKLRIYDKEKVRNNKVSDDNYFWRHGRAIT